MYVVFDVLHNGASALNVEPLEARLRLLRQFVKSGESGERPRAACVKGPKRRALSRAQTRFGDQVAMPLPAHLRPLLLSQAGSAAASGSALVTSCSAPAGQLHLRAGGGGGARRDPFCRAAGLTGGPHRRRHPEGHGGGEGADDAD